jgi:hypothetical protein
MLAIAGPLMLPIPSKVRFGQIKMSFKSFADAVYFN